MTWNIKESTGYRPDQHPCICKWCIKKARRRYLRSLVFSAKCGPVASSSLRSRHRSQAPRKGPSTGAPLNIIPGYIMLVIDTNILLSSLSSLGSILEHSEWTIVVPVPVIMELDGLSSNTAQLEEAARAAMI
jgi:protein SMG6